MKYLQQVLKEGTHFKIHVYPYPNGAVTTITILPESEKSNSLEFSSEQTKVDALKEANVQQFVGGVEVLNYVHFGGTNIFIDGFKIILIKDDSSTEWSDTQARYDVYRVFSGRTH